MMRLPRFNYSRPAHARGQAASWLAESPGDAMLVAGGTDLLPNMKRRQQTPGTIDLAARASTSSARTAPSGERHGASARAVTLTPLVRDDARSASACAGLWQAAIAGRDAAPAQHGDARRQPLPRHALQLLRPDLRVAEGDRLLHEEGRRRPAGSPRRARAAWRCRPPTPRRCCRRSARACRSSRHPASASCPSPSSTTTTACTTSRGGPTRSSPTSCCRTRTGWRSTYWKLRRRGSFDFPVAAVAAAARLDSDGRVEEVRLVPGAVASRPLGAPNAEALLVGKPLTDERIAAAAHAVYDVAKPMDNTDFDLRLAQEDGHGARHLRPARAPRGRHARGAPAAGARDPVGRDGRGRRAANYADDADDADWPDGTATGVECAQPPCRASPPRCSPRPP